MMWKKRKDETAIEKSPEPIASPGLTSQRSAATLPPAPAPRPPKAETAIGKSVTIKGQIHGQEDIFLDGTVEGTMELPANRLTVGKNGKLQASIKAREVEVLGTVQGDIVAGEKIIIRRAANLVGDLKSATISIEDGAYFKGSIDIVRQAPSKPPAQAPAATAPAGGGVPRTTGPGPNPPAKPNSN